MTSTAHPEHVPLPSPRRPRRPSLVDVLATETFEAQPARTGRDAHEPRAHNTGGPSAPPESRRVRRGSLLAVCGLCGGAGASTLSLLIARYALGERGCPVLVCDTGGPAGGLAAYAQTEAQRSLLEVAELVQDGLPPGTPFATATDGLRVLATGPRLPHPTVDPIDGTKTVLEHARTAHPLTVVDCGTLAAPADHIALRAATHIAWVLPATRSAIARGQRVLDALNTYLLGRQLLIARRDHAETKAPTRDLDALARRCGGPLILIPHLPDLHHGRPTDALEAAQVGLQAILGALAR